ncbi:MAG: sigma-54-dependent Fis family transcriptional regulator [Bradymonadales bacterium]|nr:MAG: sigma-54-dependent Fis family transcriptional regulator [Bradymonadales bacterium]
MEAACRNDVVESSRPSDCRGKRLSVLIVDDDAMTRDALSLSCSNMPGLDANVLVASTIEEALAILSTDCVQVMLLDKHLGRDSGGMPVDGISFIPEFLEAQPELQILIVTGMKSFSDCVEAMRLGAFGYVPKDTPQDYLAEQIKRACEHSMLKNKQIRIDRGEQRSRSHIEFPGNSQAVKKLRSSLAAVAETSRPVLLNGETGTGKTTAAKWIHQHRESLFKEKDQPFFALNMGALPSNLIESELYGYERGAFTDAKSARAGYIELANGGTLFLDEIGEASLDLQSKLLKIIEEGKFIRIGGTTERKSIFKLVCATNRNLERMVADGTFREDLYMRISTFVVTIPNLVDRKDDMPEIIKAVLKKCCEDNSRFVAYRDLPEDLIAYLVENPPRGNIRGIEQFLSRLLVHAPRDSRGRPVLTNWARIRELRVQKSRRPKGVTPISIEELRTRSIDFLDPQFPGAPALTDEINNSLMMNVLESTGTQRAAARVLGITQGLISQRLQKIKTKEARL